MKPAAQYNTLPSRLIDEFLPSVMVKDFVDSVVIKENNVINCHLFHAALCFYFDHQQCSHEKHANLRLQIARLFAQGEGMFDKIRVIERRENRMEVHSLSSNAMVLMFDIGANCAVKTLFPFSENRRKEPAFIVSVASSFEHVFQRLQPLWTLPGGSPFLINTGLILREIVACNGRGDYAQARLHAKCALESWCLDIFPVYSSLTDSQKATSYNAATREMFWGASFFYAMLGQKSEEERKQKGLVIPPWDRDGCDLHAWIDARLAVYLGETGAEPRQEFYRVVHDTRKLVLDKRQALLRLEHAIVGFHRDLAQDLADVGKRIQAHDVESFYRTPEQLRQIQYDVNYGLNLALFVAEDHISLHAVSDAHETNGPAASARSVQSIIAEVDGAAEPPSDGVALGVVDSHVERSDAIEWVEEDSVDNQGAAAQGPKPTRNERRRIAKERRIAEATSQMKALYDKTMADVAALKERAAVDAAKDHEAWLEDKFPLMIQAANERIRKAVEAQRERERLAVEAAEQQRRREEELALEQRRREEELALEQRRRAEELANQRAAAAAEDRRRLAHELAQKIVSDRLAQGTLPRNYTLSFALCACPALQDALDPVECFICLQPIDFQADQGVRFLTCCDGGSFACSDCIGIHNQHPITGETPIVHLMAGIRRALLQ
jgi:hypothetical protein